MLFRSFPFPLATELLQCHYRVAAELLQCPYSVATVLLQCPYSVPTVSLQCPYRVATVSLQSCYSVTTELLQCCYKAATVLLQSCYSVATELLQCCYKAATELLPGCYSVATVLLQCATELLQGCYRVAMVLLQCCYRVATELLQGCYRVATELLPCYYSLYSLYHVYHPTGLLQSCYSFTTKLLQKLYRLYRLYSTTGIFCAIQGLLMHLGLELGQQDDLESLAYILIYFLRGNLPWQGLLCKSRDIIKCKQRTAPSKLCCGLPAEFSTFLEYSQSLSFEDDPDYGYISDLFNNLSSREGFQNAAVFDWDGADKEQRQKSADPASDDPGYAISQRKREGCVLFLFGPHMFTPSCV